MKPNELTSEAVELLDALFGGPLESQTVSDSDLAGLLLGTIPDADRQRVFRGIHRCPAASSKMATLLEAQDSLSENGVIDLTQASINSWGFKALREALAAYAGPITETPSGYLRWLTHRVGANLRRLQAAPRYALARGAGLNVPAGHFPKGVEVSLHADLLEDGALTAVATVRETVPGAAVDLAGVSAILDMVDPLGGAVPVGAAKLHNGRWTFRADAFGPQTGLPTGSLPAGSFRLGVETMGSSSDIKRLWLDVDDDTLLVDLVDGPRLSNGDLVLRMEMPKAAQSRYPERTVELFVGVGRALMKLGAWPLSQWNKGPITIRVPIGEIADGDLACGSVIQARLV